MGRRELLTDEERRLLFGIPIDRDQLARLYTLSNSDRALIDARRRSSNRLGFALQLALLRHPGIALQLSSAWPDELVAYLAGQLGLDASVVGDYARRGQTLTDHGRGLAAALGLRPPVAADLPLMIEAAAIAAWPTDKGLPIATGIVAALRAANIILPAPAVIERTGAAGRARARKRVSEALLAGLNDDQLSGIDGLLTVDAKRGLSNLAWLKAMPTSPKADHVRELVDRLVHVRKFGISADRSDAIHPDRFRQLVREGRGAHAYLLDRYSVQRRRAVLVAFAIDVEARLTDAAIEMADKLIGGAFTRARNTEERKFTATARDVGRLMRLFEGTIDALASAADTGDDALAAVDQQVGWWALLKARGEVSELARTAGQDPLIRAADRYATLRKFAPLLLEVLDFKESRASDQTLAAVQLLRDMNKSGKRDLPGNAPMPFKKEWRKLVIDEKGKIDRRLWETATLAHLRNKWRSGDVWVERSANYRRFDSYLLPPSEAAPIAASLGLPATAGEWLESRGRELDWRLKRFAHRLKRGLLDGVELRDKRLHISPVRATTPADAEILADQLDGLLPPARLTEILHEVARDTGFMSAFTNLRTGEACANENALLAAILADATNLGVARMAEASQGVSRDQLV